MIFSNTIMFLCHLNFKKCPAAVYNMTTSYFPMIPFLPYIFNRCYLVLKTSSEYEIPTSSFYGYMCTNKELCKF